MFLTIFPFLWNQRLNEFRDAIQQGHVTADDWLKRRAKAKASTFSFFKSGYLSFKARFVMFEFSLSRSFELMRSERIGNNDRTFLSGVQEQLKSMDDRMSKAQADLNSAMQVRIILIL